MVEDSQLKEKKKEKIAIKDSTLSLSLSTLGSITCVLLYARNSKWWLAPQKKINKK